MTHFRISEKKILRKQNEYEDANPGEIDEDEDED
jgi:hypothetical protein